MPRHKNCANRSKRPARQPVVVNGTQQSKVETVSDGVPLSLMPGSVEKSLSKLVDEFLEEFPFSEGAKQIFNAQAPEVQLAVLDGGRDGYNECAGSALLMQAVRRAFRAVAAESSAAVAAPEPPAPATPRRSEPAPPKQPHGWLWSADIGDDHVVHEPASSHDWCPSIPAFPTMQVADSASSGGFSELDPLSWQEWEDHRSSGWYSSWQENGYDESSEWYPLWQGEEQLDSSSGVTTKRYSQSSSKNTVEAFFHGDEKKIKLAREIAAYVYGGAAPTKQVERWLARCFPE